MRWKWCVEVVLAGLAILVSLSGLFYPIHFDEGVFWTMGQEINRGAVPYRDYFDHKPPGIYFVTSWFQGWCQLSEVGCAMLHKIWGLRLMVMGVNWVAAGLIYLIARKLGNTRKIGLLGGVSYLVLLQVYQGQYGLTEPWMGMWSILAVWLILKIKYQKFLLRQKATDGQANIKNKVSLFLFFLGICLGMAVLFNQKAVISILVFSFWFLVFGQKNWQRFSWYIYMFLGIVLVWIPVLEYFYLNQALGDFWRAAVVFNFWEYQGWPFWTTVKELPRVLGPGVGLWIGVGWIVIVNIKNTHKILKISNLKLESSSSDDRLKFEALLWLMVLAPLPLILTRPYHHYWIQILPFAILLVIGAGKNVWIGKWLLILNVLIVGIWVVVYAAKIGYPQQRLQLTKVAETRECGDFRQEPWRYYLSGCRPKEKWFYEME